MSKLIIAVAAVALLACAGPVYAQVIQAPILSPGSTQAGATANQGQAQDQETFQQQGLFDSSKHSLTVNSAGTPIPLGLPGFFSPYPNFTAPIVPSEKLMNGSAFRPRTISYEDAEGCAGSAKVKNYGRSRGDRSKSLAVLYVGLDKDIPTITDGKMFLGTALVTAEETPLESVLCRAFVEAMDRGAAGVIVESATRFRTKQWGIGFGGSGGATGMDATKLNPYIAAATAVGFGTGFSSVEAVEKAVVKLSLTYQEPGKKAGVPGEKVSYLPAPQRPVEAPAVVPAAYTQGQ